MSENAGMNFDDGAPLPDEPFDDFGGSSDFGAGAGFGSGGAGGAGGSGGAGFDSRGRREGGRWSGSGLSLIHI